MTLKKFLRKIYRFFNRIYWQGRFGEVGASALIARGSTWQNPRGIALGSCVLIKRGCKISARQLSLSVPSISLRIGNGSSLQQGCKVAAAESITIGNEVMIADNVFITDHDHIFDHPQQPPALVRELRTAPVVIEDGCWLGYGSVVLKGVRIGARSVIGANAVVTKDIPPYSVAVGNPARVIRKIEWPPEAG